MSQSWSINSSDPPPPPPPLPSPPPPPPLSCDSDPPSDGEDDIIEPNPNNWFFDKERLENTPSRKMGIDADRELMYRQQSANFIQDMGQRLQVNQLCINTAIVYMHRFYMYHSFSIFSRNNVSTASIFLAAKVEEQPRKLEYVIKVAHYCLHRESVPSIDIKSEAYTTQCTDLVNTENILLQTLGFDVGIDHPHTHVVKCCQLVRASKDLAQTSYFMATNSLHLTMMCMQYRPSVVACVCIHLACKWSNWEIPRSKEGRDWYWYVDDSVTAEQLEALTTEFLTIFNKSPSRLKKKIISLSAATSGSGGMNMSNFPSHFDFDAFNPNQKSTVSGPAPGPSKPRLLPPYSKSGQHVPQPAGGNQPLSRPSRPPSVPTRDPSMPPLPPYISGSMKPPPPPPQAISSNKHSTHPPRPIPTHHAGQHSGSSHPPMPKDGRDPSKLQYPQPTPPIYHQTPHNSYPQHHGGDAMKRPPSHGLTGTGSNSQGHVQPIHGQTHNPAGQKPQPHQNPLVHSMSSQHRPPSSTNPPLKPLLPPGTLPMKHPLAPGSGIKPPAPHHQQPLGPAHPGQLKRSYTEMSRPENRPDMNVGNNAKRECLPTDVRRSNPTSMPMPPPPPSRAQLQSLATQARVREKSEKMNAVQMAMLKKPHDNLTWAGTNKQSMPELPPHTLLQKLQPPPPPPPTPPPPPEPSHYPPPQYPLHSNLKSEFQHGSYALPAAIQPISVPKHDFSVVSHPIVSNHGNNINMSTLHSTSTLIPKNEFAQPFRHMSPIVKNEQDHIAPPASIANNNNPPSVKPMPNYLKSSKEYRKTDLGTLFSSVKNDSISPLQSMPELLGTGFGGVFQRNEHSTGLSLSLSLPLKNMVKKDPAPPPPPPQQTELPSMPVLELGAVSNLGLSSSISAGNSYDTSIGLGGTATCEIKHETGREEASGSKKSKKKKKEHKNKDRHKEKDEKKHKDRSEKKHRDEDKKKHRDKDEKRHAEKEEKKHKDKDEGRKHKKDKQKDKKESRDKRGKSNKQDNHPMSMPMITAQSDQTSSKIKIVFGRGNGGAVGENSKDSGKSSKKQHATASVVYY